MPADPLTPFLKGWQKRVAEGQRAGLNPEVFRPIFQMDFQRLQQGTQPYTNQEAVAALGAAGDRPPITNQGPSKPDWNPLHLLGGIGKDIGTTLKELPQIPGALLKDASHIGQMPGQIAKGAGEIAKGDVGHGLQDIARAPGILPLLLAADFIPGVGEATLPVTAAVLAAGEAGKAMTPEGRKEISQHPGVTLLNLLPAAKSLDVIGGVSKVADLSDAEKARVMAGGMTEEELAKKTMVRVPGRMRAKIMQTPAYEQASEKLAGKGMGTDMRAMYRAVNEGQQVLANYANEVVTQHGINRWAELPEGNLATSVDDGSRAAITRQMGFARQKGETIETSLAKAGVPSGEIRGLATALGPLPDAIYKRGQELVSQGHYMNVPVGGGEFEIYHPEDVVARSMGRVDDASSSFVSSLNRLDSLRAKVEVAQSRAPTTTVDGLLESLKPLMAKDHEANGVDGKVVQAVGALDNVKKGAQAASEGSGYQARGLDSQLVKASKLLEDAGLRDYARQVDAIRGRELPQVKVAYDKALESHKKIAATYKRALGDFHRKLSENPSPRFMPIVEDRYWEKMGTIAQGLYKDDPAANQMAIDMAGARMKEATFTEGPMAGQPVFPMANQVLRDVSKEWLKMRSEGLDPVFLHKMAGDYQATALPRINPGQFLQPSVLKKRALDVSGGYYDLGFGFVRSQAEFESDRIGRAVIEDHVIPHLTKDANATVQKLLDRKRAAGFDATAGSVRSELMSDHTEFDASGFGVKGRIKGSTDRIITKDIQRQIDKLAGPGASQNWIMRGMRKGTGVYIFAVTGLSPLHMAHVAMSNLFMGMTTDPVGQVMNAQEGWALMHGRGEFATEQQALSLRAPSEMPEDLAMLREVNGAGAKTGLRLAVESKMPVAEKGLNAADQAKHYAIWFPKKLQEFQTKADEWMSSFARATNYVARRTEGWDPEQAIKEVGRTFAIHADLNPFERSVMRSFAPFYSWSKHLIRFTAQYPLDHPVRAGIVSNFAQTEAEDWGKGLPQDFAQLFFLGHPDPNTGRQTAFDIRQINPLRDVGRDFTWAGFVSQLHPVIGASLQSMGLNTYAGSAELYPELTVDPNTGSLKAKGSSFLGNLAQEAVPQTKAIAGLLGWSDQMRRLQQTDPVAFRDSIARTFHFPWLPRSISIPQSKGRYEINTMKVAQQAISNAMKNGDFSEALKYDRVPFQGQFVKPEILQKLYAALQAKNTGFTPNTLLRR